MFFIDRNLSDEDLIVALRAFEFKVISHYEYYTIDSVPDPQKVPDEDIIRACAENEWVLLTADREMEYTHFATIRANTVAIVIVPDNKSKPTRWAESMVKGRSQIYRAVKNYRQPLVGRLNGQGTLYQLRCVRSTDTCPSDGAMIICDGKTDHDCAKRNRKKAG